MTMKRFALSLSALFLAAFAALAQQGPPPGGPMGGPGGGMRGMSGMSIEQLTTDLNLTEKQQPTVKKIIDDNRAKMDAERQKMMSSGQQPDMQAMRATMQKNAEEVEKQLSTVLTAEQMTTYKKMQEERRARMQQMMQGGTGAPPPAR
jgi:Spy/CpxP family protein refolding chaperone